MKDVSGVVKVVEWIDSDVKETNIWINRRTKELKQLESRFDNLADRLCYVRIRPDLDVPREGRKVESGGQLSTVLTRTRAGRYEVENRGD